MSEPGAGGFRPGRPVGVPGSRSGRPRRIRHPKRRRLRAPPPGLGRRAVAYCLTRRSTSWKAFSLRASRSTASSRSPSEGSAGEKESERPLRGGTTGGRRCGHERQRGSARNGTGKLSQAPGGARPGGSGTRETRKPGSGEPPAATRSGWPARYRFPAPRPARPTPPSRRGIPRHAGNRRFPAPTARSGSGRPTAPAARAIWSPGVQAPGSASGSASTERIVGVRKIRSSSSR